MEKEKYFKIGWTFYRKKKLMWWCKLWGWTSTSKKEQTAFVRYYLNDEMNYSTQMFPLWLWLWLWLHTVITDNMTDLPLVIWCLTVQALSFVFPSESSLLSDASPDIFQRKVDYRLCDEIGLSGVFLLTRFCVLHSAVKTIYCGCIVKETRIIKMRGQLYSRQCCCPNLNPHSFGILVFGIIYLMWLVEINQKEDSYPCYLEYVVFIPLLCQWSSVLIKYSE